MTSSLVGSEMCIRDRPKDAWYQLRKMHVADLSMPLGDESSHVFELPNKFTDCSMSSFCGNTFFRTISWTH
eukprot:252758-Prorocentrum_lima.AAC.2